MRSAAAAAARLERKAQYDSAEHKALKRHWTAVLAAAGQMQCHDPAPGCRGTIVLGQPWDLAHDHHDRSRLLGPACRRCNRWWAAYLTNMRARARKLRRGQVARSGVFGPLSS